MRIGIDARFYGPKVKGLGRYLEKLVEHLEEIEKDSENEYFIFLKKEGYEGFQPKNERFRKVLADFEWYGWREQLAFPFFLKKHKLDLMHFGHFNVPLFFRGKFVVTIHDLILFYYPTFKNTTLNKIYYLFKLSAYRVVIQSAIRRAQKIITVSEFTKKDILENFKIHPRKIEVIKEGYEFDEKKSHKNSKTILKKYGIVKPYLLYVGNAYPHKNLERLCSAFKQIRKKRKDLSLILVGGKDFFYDRLEEFIKKENISGVQLPGFVPDEHLGSFYSEAECYTFPSLYEGFGLPPLEALSQGCAAVSSNRSSMPEILGEGALYFDPENVEEMKAAIEEILSSPGKREDLLKKGRERLKLFSWEKSARETLQVYKSVLQ